jgi:hypothetical protein
MIKQATSIHLIMVSGEHPVYAVKQTIKKALYVSIRGEKLAEVLYNLFSSKFC